MQNRVSVRPDEISYTGALMDPSRTDTAPPKTGLALTVVTTVFFMWGFVTVLNDILVPHLKALFELNYTQTMLIQFTFFSAYFLMSVPSSRILARVGYQKSIVLGLAVMGLGAAVLPGGRGQVVCLVSGRAVGARLRDHAAAGGGQPVRGPTGAAREGLQPLESGAGLQLARDHHRAVSRWIADPFGDGRAGRLGGRPTALHRDRSDAVPARLRCLEIPPALAARYRRRPRRFRR